MQQRAPENTKSTSVEVLRVVLPLVILAAGAGGFFAFGKRAAPQPKEQGKLAPLVETAVVAQHDEGLQLQIDGITVPYREVEISAEVAGRITQKSDLCRAGTYVRKQNPDVDDPLIQIDETNYALEARRLDLQLLQANDELEETRAEQTDAEALAELARDELKLQQADLERIKNLKAKNAVSTAEVDKALQRELTARNNLVRLASQARLLGLRINRLDRSIKLAMVQREKAEKDLQRTKIHMPFDGVVINDLVEKNEYVQVGTPLVVVEDTSRIEVRCSLRMEELDWIWRQRGIASPTGYELPPVKAKIRYQLGGQAYQWDGHLDRYEGLGLNEKTRTVPCRVVVNNPRDGRTRADAPPSSGPPALVRGMYVQVTLSVDPEAHLLRIPTQALRPDNTVWKTVAPKDDPNAEAGATESTQAEGDKTLGQLRALRRVPVTVVETLESGVLIRAQKSQLEAGDHVIVSPLETARDDMAVRERQP